MAGQMQNLPNIQGIRNAQTMSSTMGNSIPNAGPNVMQQTNTTAGTLNPNINMAANIGQQANATGPTNTMVGQMNPMINQMNPMMRNQNAPNAMFQGSKLTIALCKCSKKASFHSFFDFYFQFVTRRRISNHSFVRVRVHQHHHQWAATCQIK